MVGIFSRFSVSRAGHRRTQTVGRAGHRRSQSAINEREVLEQNSEIPGPATTTAASHGIEVAVEFKPVEHPNEPLDNDRPVQCPLPEPSILNDGRLWKERVSATVRRRSDISVMKEGESLESDSGGDKRPPRPTQTAKRMILPSLSAPEHNILKLLEECNTSGI